MTADGSVQVKFFTKLPAEYHVLEGFISVPKSLTAVGLSDVVNHLIPDRIPEESVRFDFLIEDVFLRSSLEEYLTSHSLSSEAVLNIEYIIAPEVPAVDNSFPADDVVVSVAKVTDDMFIAGSADGTVMAWTLGGTKLSSIRPAPFSARSLAVRGTQAVIASGSGSSYLCNVVLDDNGCDLVYSAELVGHEDAVMSVSGNDEGLFVTGSADTGIRVFDTRKLQSDEPPASKRAKLAVAKLSCVRIFEGHTQLVSSVSLRGSKLFSGSWDHSLRLSDVSTGEVTDSFIGPDAVLSMSVTNCSRTLIATGHADGCVRVWDPLVKDGKVQTFTARGHAGFVTDVQWSPSSARTFASVGHDGYINIWDVRSSTPLHKVNAGSSDAKKIYAAAWVSPSVLAFGGEDKQCHTLSVH